MWFLLFVALINVPGISHKTIIEKYSSFSECERERKRITIEMEKAYPGDYGVNYKLVCETPDV